MDRAEALEELATEWRARGVVGAAPSLWDLAVALARAGITGDGDESAAGDGEQDPGSTKAE